MARDEYGIDRIDSAVELGKANKKSIPLVKNWCKHIKIIDKSAGMIAEMYQLPMNLTICCPHTTNEFTAANFNWIANDFIIDNCIDCSFHIEVSANNYGRPLIEKHNAQLIAAKQKLEDDQKHKDKIKSEIEAVIKSVPSKKKTASLSILKLIQSLNDIEEMASTAEKILEASKLSPEFFSEASVDYLSIYFEQDFGNIILEAVNHIIENGTQISPFTFGNLVEAVKNPATLEVTSKILNSNIPDTELESHKLIFESIVDNCDYDDSYGRRHLTDIAYINAAQLFSRLFHVNIKMFNAILEAKLKNEEKSSRINCCGFLVDLANIDPKMIIKYIPLLLKSFEFKEDGYGNSADSATRVVLKKIYQYDPELLLDSIDQQYEKLSALAKVEILKFYSKLLDTNQDFSVAEKYSALIIQKLITLLQEGTKNEILKEKLLETVKEISNSRPLGFIPHFDSLLGFLVTAHQEQVKLNWNINDLKNIDRPALTFNPLIGKDYYQIESLKLRTQQAISITQNIIENIIKENPDDFYDKVLQIIINLDSKKEEALKTSLIDILRKSLKDTVNISRILPNIHSFIHDIDSEAVRDSGMKYLVHIIEKHPQIVTQTFINTVKIFLQDPVILIRGRAIEAYGSIMRTLPENVAEKELDIIIDYTVDNYVFIHKQAVMLSYKLFPFLDESRLNKLTINLIKLEHIYFEEKDFNYCKDLIDYLLFITKSRPEIYANIVNKILVKNCSTKDYYTELNAIEKLTQIATEFDKFESLWLPNAINFLLHTRPDPYNQGMDKRKKLFAKIYDIKPEVLKEKIELFTAFIQNRIDQSIFADIKEAYSILAYFCFYDELNQLTGHFSSTIPDNASLQYMNAFNNRTSIITKTELSAMGGKLELTKLKMAKGI